MLCERAVTYIWEWIHRAGGNGPHYLRDFYKPLPQRALCCPVSPFILLPADYTSAEEVLCLSGCFIGHRPQRSAPQHVRRLGLLLSVCLSGPDILGGFGSLNDK